VLDLGYIHGCRERLPLVSKPTKWRKASPPGAFGAFPSATKSGAGKGRAETPTLVLFPVGSNGAIACNCIIPSIGVSRGP
jgi:hypothetical protein